MRLPPTLAPLTLPATAIVTPGRKHGLSLANMIITNSSYRKRVILGSIDLYLTPHVVIASSFLGSQAAQLVLEALITGGVARVVFVGIAAGIALDSLAISIGDIVLPEFFLNVDDNAENGSFSEQSCSSRRLAEPLYSTLIAIARLHGGGAASVSSPKKETADFVRSASTRGVVVVDMESAAIARVCAESGTDFAAILVISDLLGSEWTPGFSSMPFIRSMRQVLRAVGDIIARANPEGRLLRIED